MLSWTIQNYATKLRDINLEAYLAAVQQTTYDQKYLMTAIQYKKKKWNQLSQQKPPHRSGPRILREVLGQQSVLLEWLYSPLPASFPQPPADEGSSNKT
ncbi:hypothetical protein Y1Q_0007784 [Alligator mississippiensis]|uniref:Uncharacterized protein n=1 Tax=Alligator mississippiensis TaxID=8496 RepID=A0A151N763_ALLMI|nr:hypothetical protein Y1Q_0007784 [Alligator mississippiensis]